MEAEDLLRAHAARVDARLEALLPPVSQAPAELHEAMRYSCLAPGKRLRPALVLASAEAVGEAGPGALDAACAVEMVHAFSLIHDDLPAIDNDDLRRGRPTCHVQFGEALAILAGDALFALAFEVLALLEAPAESVVRCLRSLARAVGSDGLVGGEVADVLAEGRPADDATVRFIHARKTGALIASSCEIGAVLGGGSPAQVEALRRYGEEVGLAFQIADDLLNELSTVEALGKAARSDRERQKATYPALHGVEGSRAAAEEAVARAQGCLVGIPGRGALGALAAYAAGRLR